MTTPDGRPTDMDSRAQIDAAPTPLVAATNVELGRDIGVFVADKETKVLGVDQDKGATAGDYDVSGQETLRENIANTPALSPQFTRSD